MKFASLVVVAFAATLVLASSALAAAPPNDAFGKAATLPVGATELTLGTTAEASSQSGEGDHGGNPPAHSVWYSVKATETGRLLVFILAEEFVASATVYGGGTLESLDPLADSSEFFTVKGEKDGHDQFDTEVVLDVTKGTTYKIAVDTRQGAPNEFGIASFIATGLESNDMFAAPKVLTGEHLSLEGDTRRATSEANEGGHAHKVPTSTLWYAWTAPSDGPTTISVAPEEDAVLGVYTGSEVDHLSTVAEAGDESSDAPSLTFQAVGGTTYRIVVDGGFFTPGGGPFTMKLDHEQSTPPGGGPGGGGSGVGAVDTRIDRAPKSVKLKGKAKKAKVTLKLSSPTAGASFECSVDHGSFKACPATFAVSLKKGKHTIEVRAKAADGSLDATPATATVKVKPVPKPKHKKKH